MSTIQPTSLEISEVKDIEISQTLVKSNLSMSILESVYTLEKKSFKKLIRQKAKRLQALEVIDLFSIPEIEAQSITKQISLLTRELNILYGFELFTDHLENAYLESIDQTYDACHYLNLTLEIEIYTLTRKYNLLSQEYSSTCDSISLMTAIIERQAKDIISLKQNQKK